MNTTVHSTLMLGAGAYIALPVVLLNFLERGGKSEHEMLANTNHSGMDILLSKREQRDFWVELADAYYSRRNWQQAAAAYEHTIQLEESFRLTLSREDRRVGYFSNYQRMLDRLIASLFAEDRLKEALAYMELGKAKTLRDSFLSSRARQLERKAVRKVLLASAQIETTAGKKEIHQEELDSLHRSIQVLRKETAAENGGKTAFLLKNIINTRFDLESLSCLGNGVTAINYYVAEEGVYAVAVRNRTVICGLTTPISRAALADLVRQFNVAGKNQDRAEVRSLGGRLYDILIADIAAHFTGDTLLISPHGLLHSLPFAALYHNGFLIEGRPIGYVYSLSFLDLLYQRHGRQPLARSALRSLIMGNPVNTNFPMAQLPGAELEARQVAATLRNAAPAGNTTVYLNADASEERLRQTMGHANLLHLATHAKFDRDNAEQSFLLLSDGNGQDGLLHAEELYEMATEKGLELVVLSSCESGATSIQPGDDPYGLPRSWFYVGAKRILSTFWPIDDRSTTSLMKSYYHHLVTEHQDQLGALQLAQIEQIHRGSVAWIPFKLEGMPE